MPLLEDLRKLGETLVSSEVPNDSETQHLVGALVKTLEAAGTTVTEDLFPAAAPAVSAVEAIAAPAADQALVSRIHELEQQVESFLSGGTPPAPTEPAPPAPAQG